MAKRDGKTSWRSDRYQARLKFSREARRQRSAEARIASVVKGLQRQFLSLEDRLVMAFEDLHWAKGRLDEQAQIADLSARVSRLHADYLEFTKKVVSAEHESFLLEDEFSSDGFNKLTVELMELRENIYSFVDEAESRKSVLEKK